MLYILVVNTEKNEISRGVWLVILASVVLGGGSLFLLPLKCSRQVEQLAVTTEGAEQTMPGPIVIKDLGAAEMLKTIDFWVLLVVLTIGQGMGLSLMANDAQMLQSYSGRTRDATAYVAMISCFNGLGRLAYGNISEAMLPRISRMWFLVLSCLLLSVSYWMIFFLGHLALWPAGAVIGAAYGGLWGVQPVIVAEIFGPRHYGVKYACSAMAAIVGQVIFAQEITATLYDRETRRLGTGNSCLKASCFSTSCLVLASCGLVSVLVGVGLHWQTRHMYSQIRTRLRGAVEENMQLAR